MASGAQMAQDPFLLMEGPQAWSAATLHAHTVHLRGMLFPHVVFNTFVYDRSTSIQEPGGGCMRMFGRLRLVPTGAEHEPLLKTKSCLAGSEVPCGANVARLCELRGHVQRAKSACARLLSCTAAADMGLSHSCSTTAAGLPGSRCPITRWAAHASPLASNGRARPVCGPGCCILRLSHRGHGGQAGLAGCRG